MANPEHVAVVRQGAAAIAEWRRRNPRVRLDLREADLVKAHLRGVDLFAADLRGADLSEAYLTGADLSGTNLSRAALQRAHLRGAEGIGADFTEADLTKIDLSAAYLTGAKFTGAVLIWANLFRANLTMANLSGADCTRTVFVEANLHWVSLTAAKLFETDLGGANLFRAELTRTDLAEACLLHTSLGACDLSQATGLSTVNHQGPSSIGVDTLIASFRGAGNKLTADLELFFLGAGVPKELLGRLPEIVGAVEFLSCFIAYGQPDEEFAKKLCSDLEARGVPCWFYPMDATPGERIWPEIGLARRQADKMLVICSVPALIRDGVLKEIEEQIDEDPNKIVPVSRDNTWNQPGFAVARGSRQLKPFVDERNYADFSDESRYDESLERLLKALRRKAE